MSNERLEGQVVSYGDDRGFGFVRGPDGTDYFIRFDEITMDGYRTLAPGDTVTFVPHHDPVSGERQALDIRHGTA